LTPGIYLITSVTDRELRLRYLLNFIGMRSTSYFTGIVIADLTIFFIPTLLVTSIIFILNLDMLKGSVALFSFLGTMILFGLSFINILNLIGFTMKSSEKAYKQSSIWMMVLAFGIPYLASIIQGIF
jgi:hypothetical protein